MILLDIYCLIFLYVAIVQATTVGISLPPVRQKDLKKGIKSCLRYEAPANELVVLRLNVGSRVDGQSLNLRIFDSDGNLYRSKDNLENKVRIAFTALSTGNVFDVCLENFMVDSSWSRNGQSKDIIVDVEIGDNARIQNSFQQNEKYSPILEDLKNVDNLHMAMYLELALLIELERQLRNINENTQAAYVKYQVIIIVILITMGICQLVYYRYYFKSKKLL